MEITQTTSNVNHLDNSKKADETTKTKSSFDMSKPFNIDSFTFDDYKNISFEKLYEWTKDDKKLSYESFWLKNMTTYTEDDTLNKVLFEKTKESYDSNGNTGDIIKHVLGPLTFMSAPMEPNLKNLGIFINENPDLFKDISIPHENTKDNLSETDSPIETFNKYGYSVHSNKFLEELRTFPSWYEKTLENHN